MTFTDNNNALLLILLFFISRLIDQNYDALESLFKECGVLNVIVSTT